MTETKEPDDRIGEQAHTERMLRGTLQVARVEALRAGFVPLADTSRGGDRPWIFHQHLWDTYMVLNAMREKAGLSPLTEQQSYELLSFAPGVFTLWDGKDFSYFMQPGSVNEIASRMGRVMLAGVTPPDLNTPRGRRKTKETPPPDPSDFDFDAIE